MLIGLGLPSRCTLQNDMPCICRLYLYGPPASDLELRSDLLAEMYVGAMVFTAGFLAAAVYSSACLAVPHVQRAMATLLVNLGMVCGIGLGIMIAWQVQGLLS